MNLKNSTQAGVTLFEILLVLAIATIFFILGMNLYYSLKLEQDANRVRANVDILFQGLKGYYQANCRGSTAVLDPSKNPSNPYPIDIPSKLVRFLAEWPLGASQFNVFPEPNYGYIVQFNKVESNRYIYACNKVDGKLECSKPEAIWAAQQANTSRRKTLIIWVSQVAQQMPDNDTAVRYQALLGANCVSNLKSDENGEYVEPCTPPPAAGGDYLVWERLPGAMTDNTSTLWPSMSIVKQFTQQYTNDDNYAFNVDDMDYNTATGYENYLCGG